MTLHAEWLLAKLIERFYVSLFLWKIVAPIEIVIQVAL